MPPGSAAPYFDHVEAIEEQYWGIDAPSSAHPAVTIPVYDDSDDDSSESFDAGFDINGHESTSDEDGECITDSDEEEL